MEPLINIFLRGSSLYAPVWGFLCKQPSNPTASQVPMFGIAGSQQDTAQEWVVVMRAMAPHVSGEAVDCVMAGPPTSGSTETTKQ